MEFGLCNALATVQRCIKDFSKTTKPLSNLLSKDKSFDFYEECLEAFENLKKQLVIAPIMCDASDYAVDAVLGQGKGKKKIMEFTKLAKS